jgi:hypothetical protein
MQKFFNRSDVVLSLILGAIGALAGFSLVNLQWIQMDDSMKSALLGQLGSRGALFAVSTVQIAILTFVASFLGVKLARHSGLRLKWLPEGKSWISIMVIGLSAALVISLGDRLIFSAFMPELVQPYSLNLLYLASSVLYGGIIEEVLMRLFVMSLLVFLLTKVARSDADVERPQWVFILAISISALFFAAGHLPATAQLLGLNGVTVARSFLLNGLAALGFGWLYWKHGLGSAMAAHILTHLIMQLAILPLIG